MANGVFSPLYRFAHGLYQEIVLEQMATSCAPMRMRARGSPWNAYSADANTKRRRISHVTFTAPVITCARRCISGWRLAMRSSATRRAKPRRSYAAQ